MSELEVRQVLGCEITGLFAGARLCAIKERPPLLPAAACSALLGSCCRSLGRAGEPGRAAGMPGAPRAHLGALGEVPQVPQAAFLVPLSGAWAPAVGSLGTTGTKSSSWRSPERQNYSAVKSTILSPWRTSNVAGLSRRAQDCFNSGYSEQKRLLAPCPPLAGAPAPGRGLAGAVSEPRPRPPPRVPPSMLLQLSGCTAGLGAPRPVSRHRAVPVSPS